MADQAEIIRHSHPLSRIVICCTSVPPDSRQALAKKAQDMGARHVLDLTSDVTHLVCGDITTPKYKYVAKMRTDVKVMKVEWIDTMYNPWINGEDIDPRDFEEKFKLPALYRLSISVTGILDVADRKKIEELVVEQEATYHPDLTRHVTHLIAAAPTGKKYEFARSNTISIVVVQWLYDSLERGMALEESCYDPRLSEETIGAGARPTLPSAIPREVISDVLGKRKIRKRAEDMLGSQSQSIWGDILGQASNPKPKKRDEWEDNSRTTNAKQSGETGEASAKNLVLKANIAETKMGILACATFYIYGYTKKQGETIKNILISYDGRIVSSIEDLKSLEDSSRLFVVVPHNLRKRDCPDVSNVGNVSIITEWWIEACMHKGRFIEPFEGFVYSTFEEFPLDGFEGLEICLTQFSGIELLHMRKLITLLGGSFQEILSKKRHLLVTALPAKGEKFDFAVQNKIPVVTAGWFEECLKQSRGMPFTDFLVGEQKRVIPEASIPSENPGSSKRTRDVRQLGENKRPRHSGINFQGGKLLGENLQSFGDRLRRKIPDEKTGADADIKTSGLPSKNRDTENLRKERRGERVGGGLSVPGGEVHEQEVKKRGILGGCVVCVSRQLKACRVELKSFAEYLGASVVESFSPDDMIPITHLIHSSKAPRDTTKDFRLANAIDGCHIVSPEWLSGCEKLGVIVDEKAYPAFTTPTRGLEMEFAVESPSSLSSVDTMELEIPPGSRIKVEREELGVDKSKRSNGPGETEALPSGDDNNVIDTTHQLPKNAEPTPPMSVPVPTLPLSIKRKPSFSPYLASGDTQGTEEPLGASEKKAPASIGNILGKLGKGELATAMDKRRKPRGKLQGKAPSNLSSYSNFSRASSVSSSRAGSIPPSQQPTGWGIKEPKKKDPDSPDKQHEIELPAPSQAIRYEDPEAEKERKSVRAKLSGNIFGVETPKSARTARRIKTAVDVEGSVVRRTKRNR